MREEDAFGAAVELHDKAALAAQFVLFDDNANLTAAGWKLLADHVPNLELCRWRWHISNTSQNLYTQILLAIANVPLNRRRRKKRCGTCNKNGRKRIKEEG
jgi:hypothetical protein